MTPQMHPSLQILPGYDLVDAKVISVVLLYHRSLIRKLATATSAFRFPIADRDDKTATRKNWVGSSTGSLSSSGRPSAIAHCRAYFPTGEMKPPSSAAPSIHMRNAVPSYLPSTTRN